MGQDVSMSQMLVTSRCSTELCDVIMLEDHEPSDGSDMETPMFSTFTNIDSLRSGAEKEMKIKDPRWNPGISRRSFEKGKKKKL